MKMFKKQRWILLPVLALILSACGNQSFFQESEPATYDTMEMAVEQDMVDDSTVSRDQAQGREVIYSASVNYQTIRYEEAKAVIEEIINQNDGFVQYQDESVNEYRYQDTDDTLTTLYMVIRVPQDNYEALLTALEGNDQAQLMQISRGSQDVTQQVQDIEIRIESIESRIERLNELNEQAESIADLIEIQTALEEAISERDILLAEQANLGDEVDNATVNLSLREVIELSDRSESQLTFWDRIVQAFEQMWQNSIDAFQWGILTLIFLIPYIVFFFILYLIIRYLLLPIIKYLVRLVRGKKDKKNKKVETNIEHQENNNNPEE